MNESRAGIGSWRLWLAGVTMAASLALAGAARAQECTTLLSLFQQGLGNVEIARRTGWTTNNVAACRRELQRPIVVGPAGAPPVGAAGPAPGNAAGPPPVRAAGPPPVGHEVRRLP